MVCISARDLLALVFIVSELVNKDVSLQILAPPMRMEAEEGLGWETGGAGVGDNSRHACVLELEASLSYVSSKTARASV